MKRLGFILFILVVLYFIFLIRQDIINNVELKRDAARLTASNISEQKLTEEMQQKLKALRTNSYIEQLARTRLGLIKKGETAYKVIGGEK